MPDLTGVHFLLSVTGALLCVGWSFMMVHDPNAKFVPPLLMFARRMCLTGVGIAMLLGALFANNRNWEPWPPHVTLVGVLDLYVLASMLCAVARRRVCQRCPFPIAGRA